MNSSVPPFRRIASNLLWTPQGLVRNPLAEVADDGRVLGVTICEAPDRESCVEFYAGLLVPGFCADYRSAFDRLLARRETPLPELLSELFEECPECCEEGALVVFSGLDYVTMRLTSESCIRKI